MGNTALSIDTQKGNGSPQFEWLLDDLSSAQQRGMFIVVVMHKGIYTNGSHSYDSEVKAMRDRLTPIFSRYGVNIVFSGHDHVYNETYFLDGYGERVAANGKGEHKLSKWSDEVPDLDWGVLYVTLGSLGDKLYNWVDNYYVLTEFGKSIHNPTLKYPTFGKLRYDGTNLYYQGFEVDESGDVAKVVAVHDITRYNGAKEIETWVYILLIVGAVAVMVLNVLLFLYVKKQKRLAPANIYQESEESGNSVATETEIAQLEDALQETPLEVTPITPAQPAEEIFPEAVINDEVKAEIVQPILEWNEGEVKEAEATPKPKKKPAPKKPKTEEVVKEATPVVEIAPVVEEVSPIAEEPAVPEVTLKTESVYEPIKVTPPPVKKPPTKKPVSHKQLVKDTVNKVLADKPKPKK
jgi:hypothetical protein